MRRFFELIGLFAPILIFLFLIALAVGMLVMARELPVRPALPSAAAFFSGAAR